MENRIIPATITPLNPVINLLTSNDTEESSDATEE
jgi:hypothetical protein